MATFIITHDCSEAGDGATAHGPRMHIVGCFTATDYNEAEARMISFGFRKDVDDMGPGGFYITKKFCVDWLSFWIIDYMTAETISNCFGRVS